MDYKLRKSGLNVLYLGTNVSINNLQQVIQRKHPDFVITYASAKSDVQHDLSDCITATEASAYYFVTAVNDIPLALPHAKARCVPYRQLTGEVLALAG